MHAKVHSTLNSKSVYFPNLNGIRFIAALLVLLSHIEVVNRLAQKNSLLTEAATYVLGRVGVILFFVLSGFLITYLLLNEDAVTGRIKIKSFYLRRILKIWPLYYLIVIIAFFILPRILPELANDPGVQAYFWPNLLLYFFFVPNAAFLLYPNVWGAAQAWSIGVEEQFYLLWPLLIQRVKNKKALFWGFIGTYEFFKFIGFRLLKLVYWNDALWKVWGFWEREFTIQCMAIGGVFAYLLFTRKTAFLQMVFNHYVQLTALIAAVILLLNGRLIPHITEEVFSLLFAVIILNAAANSQTIFKLENPVLNYLGKVSYGIYMYHTTVLLLYVHYAHPSRTLWQDYLVVSAATILVATLSYELFEKKFLRLKERFTVVKSGSI